MLLYSLWLFFLDSWFTTRWSTPWNSWLIQMWNAWCRNMTSNASHLCIVQLYKVSDGASQLQGPGSCLLKQQGFNSQELVIAECGRIRCNVHKIILITIRRRLVMGVSITPRIWMRLIKPFPTNARTEITEVGYPTLTCQVELIWWNSFWKQGLMWTLVAFRLLWS